jgi:hypothetical protein
MATPPRCDQALEDVDHTLHPKMFKSSAVTQDTLIHQGEMLKQGQLFKKWTKRFYVVIAFEGKLLMQQYPSMKIARKPNSISKRVFMLGRAPYCEVVPDMDHQSDKALLLLKDVHGVDHHFRVRNEVACVWQDTLTKEAAKRYSSAADIEARSNKAADHRTKKSAASAAVSKVTLALSQRATARKILAHADSDHEGVHSRNKEVNMIHHKEMLELQQEARTSYVIHSGYLSTNMFHRHHGFGKWTKKYVELVQMTVPVYDSEFDKEKQRKKRKVELASRTEGQKKEMVDRNEWEDKMFVVFYLSETTYQHRLYVRDAVKGGVEVPVKAEMELETHTVPLENSMYHFLCISLDANGFSAGFELSLVGETAIDRFRKIGRGVKKQVSAHQKHNKAILSGELQASGLTKHRVIAEAFNGINTDAMLDECKHNAEKAKTQGITDRHAHSFFLRGRNTSDVLGWVEAMKMFADFGPPTMESPLQPRMDARAKGLTVGVGDMSTKPTASELIKQRVGKKKEDDLSKGTSKRGGLQRSMSMIQRGEMHPKPTPEWMKVADARSRVEAKLLLLANLLTRRRDEGPWEKKLRKWAEGVCATKDDEQGRVQKFLRNVSPSPSCPSLSVLIPLHAPSQSNKHSNPYEIVSKKNHFSAAADRYW